MRIIIITATAISTLPLGFAFFMPNKCLSDDKPTSKASQQVLDDSDTSELEGT